MVGSPILHSAEPGDMLWWVPDGDCEDWKSGRACSESCGDIDLILHVDRAIGFVRVLQCGTGRLYRLSIDDRQLKFELLRM